MFPVQSQEANKKLGRYAMGGVVGEWVGARKALNKVSAEKLFDLLSRLEMKQANTDLRGIKFTVSVFSLWQRNIHLTLSVALLSSSIGFLFARSG